MLSEIKLLINSLSTREFVLLIAFIMVLFFAIIYNDLVPRYIKYEDTIKTMLNKNKLLNQYQILLKHQDNKNKLLNQKQNFINQSKTFNNQEINISKYFYNFKSLYFWVCDIENKYLIRKVIIKHTDIKGLIKAEVFAITANLKPVQCLVKEKINLANIFFTKKLVVSSIISDKVKINNVWYSKGDSISKHIFIQTIKPTMIIVKYDNDIKMVSLGDAI